MIKRDTITSYDIQYPTSIGELGLRQAEQIALLEKVQNIVLAEQSLLLDPGIHVCPICGNPLKKNGYKTSNFHVTRCEFSAAQELLVVAKGEGSSSIREWWDQKNAQDSGAQPDTQRR